MLLSIGMDRTRSGARSNPKKLLICFTHLRWNFVHQRPQHLLTRAAKEFDVVYFEEPLFEAVEAPELRMRTEPSGVRVAEPVFPHGATEAATISGRAAMLETLLLDADADTVVHWYYTPMALQFSASFPPDLCIYDCMDELSAFKGAPPMMRACEQQLLQPADLVFTGGHSLYQAKRRLHADVHCFPSSVDRNHFGAARSGRLDEPEDHRAIGRPRLGFFGVIDERMDVELVDAVARLRPSWNFVMLGPVVKIDPAILPRHENIHWLGQKAYGELPAYLAHWDIAFMPFARNDSTKFISPTKTPEFLAAGRPVISTPINDVVQPYGAEGLVEIAYDAKDVVLAAERLLEEPVDAAWLKRVDRRLSTMSWDKTWASMSTLMARALEPSGVVAVAS